MIAAHLLRTMILVAAAAFIITGDLTAQSPDITVQLFQPAPNQLKVADLWRIKIVNRSTTTYTVCLFGTLTETGIGKLLVDATTARFRVPPGTKIITGAEIQPIDANYYDDRYKQIFLRTGQAPTGEYRICVEVRNDCGSEVLATDCKDQRVQVLTPPILVAPPDESTVTERQPTFSWLPPSPLRAGQRPTYQLRIVEVLGRQTAYDALQANPAWFDRSNIPTQVFPYPISSRPFVVKHRYAWQIKAFSDGFPIGESEIWWFEYGKIPTDEGDDNPPTRRNRVDSTSILISGKTPSSFNPTFNPGNRGTVQFNPDGDVRTIFADPNKLQLNVTDLKAADDAYKKILMEVAKELLRSCNE